MNIFQYLTSYHAPKVSTQTLYLIATVWGMILPAITAVIQQPSWSDRRRATIGALISIIAGVVVSLQQDAFAGQNILACVLIVLIAAWTSFRNFWHPTSIAPWIETITSSLPKVLAAVQQGAVAGFSAASSSTHANDAVEVPASPQPPATVNVNVNTAPPAAGESAS